MSKVASTKISPVKKAAAPKAASSQASPAKKAASSKAAIAKKAAAKPAKRAIKPVSLKSKTAKPRKAATPVAPAAVGSETLNLILARLDDMKAEATVTIDLRGKSAYSDYMVVTSGRSNRHVGAVAENLAKGLKESGIKKLHVEGLTNCDWVLIDSGDVIVHVFRPEVREFYNLERMWTQPSDVMAKPA